MLARLSPLAGLGQDSLRQLATLARVESCAGGVHPLEFTWLHRAVYLLQGELKLVYPDGAVKVLVGGWDEALSRLGRNGMDPVSARAITDVELLWFDENVLDILVTWDQVAPPMTALTAGMGDATDWRAMSGLFDARQLTIGTFASLPAAHIDSLLACFQRQAVRRGDIIVRQNEPGDFYYVIERGRAQVTREVTGVCVELAELDAGDAFGEEALIAETTRNATVTMVTDGSLLRLDNADFVRLLREPLLQHIGALEAQRRVTAGAVWLDVRFPAEYQHNGLPGAHNIPLNELRDALPNMPAEREYVVYCQTGRRSSAAAFLLSQHGIAASLLEGGLKGALQERLAPTQTGESREVKNES
jgi:rhodanese-related sulfurtransferase